MGVKIVLTNGNEHFIPDVAEVTDKVVEELAKLNIENMVADSLVENKTVISGIVENDCFDSSNEKLQDVVCTIANKFCFSTTDGTSSFAPALIEILNDTNNPVLDSSNEKLKNAIKGYLSYELTKGVATTDTKLIAINFNDGTFEGYDIDTTGDFNSSNSIATIKSLTDLEAGLIGDMTSGRTDDKADVYIPAIYELTALPETGYYCTGDYCIVKDTETGTRTAYMYMEDRWEALNGNYDATNVYFKDSFKINKPFGKFIPDANTGSTNLPAEGKSIEELFKEAFASGNNPVVTPPSIKLTSKVTASAEVGSRVSSFTVLCEATGGSYSFGPDDTGVYIPVYSMATVPNIDITYDTILAGTHQGIFVDLEGIVGAYFLELDENERVNLPYEESINFQNDTFTPMYTDDKQTFKVRAIATHSAAAKSPNNDLEVPQETLKIAEGVISTFCNISIQGYRKPFWGVLTAAIDLNNLTSTTVRSLPNSGNSTKGLPTSLYVDEGACQVIFCVKAGTYSSVTANDKLAQNASITFTKHTNKVDVADLTGENATAYDIFEVTWPGPIASAKDLSLSWK